MLTGREAGKANLLEGADDTRFPVYPQHLVTQVREAMPSDGIIALDNGVYKIWFPGTTRRISRTRFCSTTHW